MMVGVPVWEITLYIILPYIVERSFKGLMQHALLEGSHNKFIQSLESIHYFVEVNGLLVISSV